MLDLLTTLLATGGTLLGYAALGLVILLYLVAARVGDLRDGDAPFRRRAAHAGARSRARSRPSLVARTSAR